MIPPIFATLSADTDVGALVGTGNSCRVYPFGYAKQGTVVPYVTWNTLSGEPLNKLLGGSFVDNVAAVVDCWSNDAAQALEIAEAVRSALEAVGYMTADNPADRDEETGLVRYSMTFEFKV